MNRGVVTNGMHRGHRRVVALGVADRQRRARRLRGGDQLVGLGERPRHRLLDEDGDAALEERQRDLVVQLRRHRDGDGVDLVEQLAIVGQRPRAGRRRRAAARSGCASTTADQRAPSSVARIRA